MLLIFVCNVFPFCLIMKKKDKLNKNIFIEKLFKIAYNQYSFKFLSEYLEDYHHEKLFSVLAVTTLAIGIVAGCGKEEKKIQLVKTRYKRLNKAVNL